MFCKLLFQPIHNNALWVTVMHRGIVRNATKLFLWPVSLVSYRYCHNEGVCGPLRLYALHGNGLDRQWRKTFVI